MIKKKARILTKRNPVVFYRFFTKKVYWDTKYVNGVTMRSETQKIGLVLEGGAMRGMFTAGVTDVFMENGIVFDGAVGVSAGATFGCNYKSKQIGRAFRYNQRFAGDKRYCSIRSLLKTGDIYNADFCYDRIPNELDPFDYKAFAENPMEFYVVASDAVTGQPLYKKLETCDASDLTWMRASASMPLVSRPVRIEGYTLLDGGMTDSIPLKFFQSIGYTKNVVVLTQPRGYVKEKNRTLPIARIVLRKFPKLIYAMAHRHEVYNGQTAFVFSEEAAGRAVVLCPDKPLGISRTEKDRDELERVYQAGREVAKRRLNEVLSFVRQPLSLT